MKTEKQPLLILTGPTAVGKTDLSIALAKRINGAVISADSMQVYRGMDIGSAKVMPEEMQGVDHYLIDVLDPDQDFNVVTFQHLAKEALTEIYSHGHVPIVAGGTGFYIQALLYDIDFRENDEASPVRSELEALAEEAGEAAPDLLHSMLQEVDPEAAGQIHANNLKRVIRAIEYFRITGEKISLHNEQERKRESPYNFLYYVVNTDRSLLYERIDRRVDQMMENGLIEEVNKLRDLGCRRGQTSMQGLGYKEILDYLEGRVSLDEAVYILKRDTRHFAKRQLTWFKRERDVRWLNLPEFENNTSRLLDQIIEDCRAKGIVI